MAESYNSYVGNGTNKNFDISFDYIAKEHVFVTVDGAPAPFTWVNAGRVQTVTAPDVGADVKVYRRTPDNPLVIFTDTSVFKSENLNLYGRQAVAIAVEARDGASDAVTDATAALANSEQAVATSNAADAKADNAITVANSAKIKADAAVTTSAAAETKADASVLTANAAAANASTALTAATTADAKAVTAIASANTATSTANAAAADAATAIATASAASTTAGNAQTNASTALAQSTTALNTANTAMAAVEGIIGVDGFPSDQIDNQSTVPGANLTQALNSLGTGVADAKTYTDTSVSDLQAYSHNTFAPIGHNHDTRYYTKSEVDTTVSGINTAVASKAPSFAPTFTGTVSGITKAMVGLGNANNTTDLDKPISTATQAALNLKANANAPAMTGSGTYYILKSVGLAATVRNSFQIEGEAAPRYGMIVDSTGGFGFGFLNNSTGSINRNAWYLNYSSGDMLIDNAAVGIASGRISFGVYGTPPLQTESRSGYAVGFGLRSDGSSGIAFQAFYKGGTGVTGSITDNGSGGISYNTTSDYRLKNIQGPYTTALNAVKSSKVYLGTWYADPTAAPEPMMLAHEIAEIIPRAVAGDKDEMQYIEVFDQDGTSMGEYPIPKHQQVDYSKLVPTLVAAIKELTAIVEQQGAEIEALKNG